MSKFEIAIQELVQIVQRELKKNPEWDIKEVNTELVRKDIDLIIENYKSFASSKQNRLTSAQVTYHLRKTREIIQYLSALYQDILDKSDLSQLFSDACQKQIGPIGSYHELKDLIQYINLHEMILAEAIRISKERKGVKGPSLGSTHAFDLLIRGLLDVFELHTGIPPSVNRDSATNRVLIGPTLQFISAVIVETDLDQESKKLSKYVYELNEKRKRENKKLRGERFFFMKSYHESVLDRYIDRHQTR